MGLFHADLFPIWQMFEPKHAQRTRTQPQSPRLATKARTRPPSVEKEKPAFVFRAQPVPSFETRYPDALKSMIVIPFKIFSAIFSHLIHPRCALLMQIAAVKVRLPRGNNFFSDWSNPKHATAFALPGSRGQL